MRFARFGTRPDWLIGTTCDILKTTMNWCTSGVGGGRCSFEGSSRVPAPPERLSLETLGTAQPDSDPGQSSREVSDACPRDPCREMLTLPVSVQSEDADAFGGGVRLAAELVFDQGGTNEEAAGSFGDDPEAGGSRILRLSA